MKKLITILTLIMMLFYNAPGIKARDSIIGYSPFFPFNTIVSELIIGNSGNFSFNTIPVNQITAFSPLFTFDTRVETYNVGVSITPADAGTVSGAGMYLPGAEVTLEALPNEGYRFRNWSDQDGNEITESEIYAFTMPEGEVLLVARFEESGVGVQEVMQTAVSVHPNPSRDIFHITSNGNIEKLRLINSNGKNVKVVEVNDQNAELGVEKFPSGIYFLQIYLTGKVITERVVIMP